MNEATRADRWWDSLSQGRRAQIYRWLNDPDTTLPDPDQMTIDDAMEED